MVDRAVLSRKEAVERLEKLIGQDIRPFADQYRVTVFKDGKLNKGWAGHTLEKHLGFNLSSLQAPNGLTWELKAVPLQYNKKKGKIWPKETMAVTMINPKDVMAKKFEESHLFLSGVTAEVADGVGKGDTIQIMMGGKPSRHVTHTITAPILVELQQTDLGLDSALQIRCADGTTNLLHLS